MYLLLCHLNDNGPVIAVQNSNDNNKEQNEGKRCH